MGIGWGHDEIGITRPDPIHEPARCDVARHDSPKPTIEFAAGRLCRVESQPCLLPPWAVAGKTVFGEDRSNIAVEADAGPLTGHARRRQSHNREHRQTTAVRRGERSSRAALHRTSPHLSSVPASMKLSIHLAIRGQSTPWPFSTLRDNRSKSRGFCRPAVATSCGECLVPRAALRIPAAGHSPYSSGPSGRRHPDGPARGVAHVMEPNLLAGGARG